MNAPTADRQHTLAVDAAVGRGLLRAAARNPDERAIIMRLELMAFLRGAKAIHWRENHARDRAFWFEHNFAGLQSGCLEGIVLPGAGSMLNAHDLAAMTDEQLLAPRVQLARLGVLRSEGYGADQPNRLRHGKTAISRFMSQYHDVLALAPSFEETLSGWGKHTRRNVRNARKRGAESGVRFSGPDSSGLASEEEVFALAQHNAPFKTPARRLRNFEAYLATTRRAFHSCLRTADGQLISYCGGFLEEGRAYLVYQLNHAAFRDLSPCLLHRGHLIEALIGAGVSELVFVSGCNGILMHACRSTAVEDAWVMRPTLSSLARTAALSLAFRGGGIGLSARTALG